jgi:hypothetical protein
LPSEVKMDWNFKTSKKKMNKFTTKIEKKITWLESIDKILPYENLPNLNQIL